MLISAIGLAIGIPFFGSDVLSVLTGEQDLTNPNHIAFLKYMQIVSHFAMFIIPAILFAWLFEGGNVTYFKLNSKFKLIPVLMGGMVMALMLPLVNYLGELNGNMVLPSGLKGLENWMKETEEQAEIVIMAFVGQTSTTSFIVNFIMIALIPAIGEELIFRGIILRKMKEWFGNVHVAVIVSAIVFSALHMQFYGFLPRMVLGVILGYMFVWSASLWMPMFAHLVNNGIAVVVAFLHANGAISNDMNSFGNFNDQPLMLVLLCVFALGAMAFSQYVLWKSNPDYNKI